MNILSIETSCDESAVAILSVTKTKTKILGNALNSQIKIHEQYGGVFPMMAKREHQKNLSPLLIKALKEANLFKVSKSSISISKETKLRKILERETDLVEHFMSQIINIKKPKIDRIAVTTGPGLEPALWVGISFAKALSILWDIPIVPTNHMRGHFLAPLAENKKIEFPALGLLISGGHTELVLAKNPLSYKLLGKTRDDACGEAYDKVARILGLKYPGGPEVAALAAKARTRTQDSEESFVLPRPMIHTKDLDFSFSGLKTAVLYMTQKIETLDETTKEMISKEFEQAVTDVLAHKTDKALITSKAKTLVVGGGVSANTYIKKNLEKVAKEHKVIFEASSKTLATDNAVMIGVAGFFGKTKPISKIKAEGNLGIEK